MGKQINILTALLVMCIQLNGQHVKRQLLSAHALCFRGTIYTYGYEQKKDLLLFKCYSYSHSLQLKDSTEFSLGRHLPADYLAIRADTLHDVLNFQFQLSDQKSLVTLLRLTTSLQTICIAENFDANHVNSLALFDSEKYYYGNDLYVVRASEDSTHKQYYLSKFSVKTITKPFEYDFKWQYALEREYIHRVSVMYADRHVIILYAHVNDGIKKGQWILHLNATTGELIKGSKLNAKNDNRHYLYSKALYDTVSKEIAIIGSIYPAAMIDFKQQTSHFTNLSTLHQLFLVKTDSMGEVTARIEKPLALPPPKKTGSVFTSFHLKVESFSSQKDSSYTVWADIYEQSAPNIMAYYSSWQFSLVPLELSYTVKAAPFYVATKPLVNFISFAKGDSYGKFYLADPADYDRFKYARPLNCVVIKTGLDTLHNQYYILKKTDLLSGKQSIHYVFPGKKELEKKVLLSSEKGQVAELYFTGESTYISFITDPFNTEFVLSLNKL